MSNQAEADAVFEALGEPVRRRILELLREGPAPVGRLAERLPVGRPAVSKHLRVLSGAGLISHRSVGTRNLYALVPGGLAPAQQWLTATWDSALTAFAGYVSQAVPSQAVPSQAVPSQAVPSQAVPRPAAADAGTAARAESRGEPAS